MITPKKIPGETGDFVICPTQSLTEAKSYLNATGYAGQTLPLYYSVGDFRAGRGREHDANRGRAA